MSCVPWQAIPPSFTGSHSLKSWSTLLPTNSSNRYHRKTLLAFLPKHWWYSKKLVRNPQPAKAPARFALRVVLFHPKSTTFKKLAHSISIKRVLTCTKSSTEYRSIWNIRKPYSMSKVFYVFTYSDF